MPETSNDRTAVTAEVADEPIRDDGLIESLLGNPALTDDQRSTLRDRYDSAAPGDRGEVIAYAALTVFGATLRKIRETSFTPADHAKWEKLSTSRASSDNPDAEGAHGRILLRAMPRYRQWIAKQQTLATRPVQPRQSAREPRPRSTSRRSTGTSASSQDPGDDGGDSDADPVAAKVREVVAQLIETRPLTDADRERVAHIFRAVRPS